MKCAAATVSIIGVVGSTWLAQAAPAAQTGIDFLPSITPKKIERQNRIDANNSSAMDIKQLVHHFFILFNADNQVQDLHNKDGLNLKLSGSKGTIVDVGVNKITILAGNCFIANSGEPLIVEWLGRTIDMGCNSEVELIGDPHQPSCISNLGQVAISHAGGIVINANTHGLYFDCDTGVPYKLSWTRELPLHCSPAILFATSGSSFGVTDDGRIFVPRGLGLLVTDDAVPLKTGRTEFSLPAHSAVALRCDPDCDFVGNYGIYQMKVSCAGTNVPLGPSVSCTVFEKDIPPGSSLCDGIPRRNHAAYRYDDCTVVSSGYQMLAFMKALPSLRAAVLRPTWSVEKQIGSNLVKTLACVSTVKGDQGDYAQSITVDKCVDARSIQNANTQPIPNAEVTPKQKPGIDLPMQTAQR